ncbi:MAG: protein kinase [Planctomycetaceae bacterium]|nr:protein kinase [Planctomycetaceae bacterium]
MNHPKSSNTNNASFLCVCGHTIPANLESGGTCDHCNREYSGRAVNLSMTLTMDLPSGSAAVATESEDDDMLGQSLDHFTIINRLGGGGMGTVYRAMDESLQRYVAIKVLGRGDQGVNRTAHVERLLQEARAQARVNHANVVHIYFVSRNEKLPYLAMELVPGQTLSARIAEGPMSYREIVRIGTQVAQALRESTQLDIVHGDIKPSNILIYEDVAKLSDFGLSHRISLPGSDSGRVAGTPNYMAPEICRGEPANIQSDMYSFGVMLFEMTFGRLPYSFTDSSFESRLDAHQNNTPEFPITWPTEIPELWRPLLEKLLAKKRANRFSSWDEVIEQMRSLRPMRPVAAGRIKRGIAWAIDLLILATAQSSVVLLGVFLANALFVSSVLTTLLIASSLCLLPAAVLRWIGAGGSSPGKNLMQLQVVDRHGLRPHPQVLGRRSIMQYLPIWAAPIHTVGLPILFTVFTIAIAAFIVIVDIMLALTRQQGQSLHDQLYDTSVVLLDAREGN